MSAEAPANLDLSALTVLTRLELRGYDCNVVQIRLMGLRMQGVAASAGHKGSDAGPFSHYRAMLRLCGNHGKRISCSH